MNENLEIIWCNSSAKKIVQKFGIQYQNHINLFEWLPFLNKNKEKILDEYNYVLKTSEQLITEETFVINNEKIYTKTIKMPLIKDSKTKYIITIVYDETSLVKSLQKIKEEKEKLFDIFDSINENIYVQIQIHMILFI
jgi:hypothetical protein